MSPPQAWSVVNWAVVELFAGVTVVGVALAIGIVNGVGSVDSGRTSPVTGPLYVYLDAGLGVLCDVVT